MKTYVLKVRERPDPRGGPSNVSHCEVVESDDRRQPVRRIIEVVDEIAPGAWELAKRDRHRKDVVRYVLPDGRVVEAREETVDQRASRLGREEVERFKREVPGPIVAHRLQRWRRTSPNADASRHVPLIVFPGDKVGTAAGDKLGVVTRTGRPWRSNMGDVRQSVRVLGINGAVYGGTAYVSASGLVRLRPIKTKGASS